MARNGRESNSRPFAFVVSWIAWLRRRHSVWVFVALLIACSSVYACTTSGRITYPDDEIVFQTTESLSTRGSWAIDGIPIRTGEKPSQPTGTFGWAIGRDGQRYGFFGHGLSLVAVPLHRLGSSTADDVPPAWTRGIRSDLLAFHRRSPDADWARIVVSLTNCLITPLAVVLLGLWARALGVGLRPAIGLALIYAFGTTAWPYTKSFLSEPLSTVVLLGSALAISRWHRERRASALAIAGLLAGLSLHVHLLNAIAVPCLLGYAAAPTLRHRTWAAERAAWTAAMALGLTAIGALLFDQWWRFGDPFETGRYADYGRWIWPFEALVTLLIAPGRSLFVYSPPLILALLAWNGWRRRDPDTAWFVLALAGTRLLLVACRSDWHGGWGIGPRYLVPLVPFLLLPLALPLERWRGLTFPRRWAHAGMIVGSIAFQGWLALHSIFQIMWTINQTHGRVHYWRVADWQWDAMPAVAFWRLEQRTLEFVAAGEWAAARGSAQFDLLALGAWRVAAGAGERGLLHLFEAAGTIGLVAALALGWLVRRRVHSPSGT